MENEREILTSIVDPSVKIKPSRTLLDFIEKLDISDDVPKNIIAVKSLDNVLLNVSDVEWLHKNISSVQGKRVYLHEVLQGSDIVLPQPEKVPRNPELEARIQKLKLEAAARDYRLMTKNVDSFRVKDPTDSIASQIKEINRQLIAVFQFIISVIAGFAFGFVGIGLFTTHELEIGFRLLLGVICALIIALAEIYFLAKKLSEDYSVPVRPTTSILKEHQE